jgi:two-component system chemotaxis response regulator CheB
MIRVLIVDDSRVAREFVAHILTSDPTIEIAGFVADGLDALGAVQRLRPDVVTMDIHMPQMDGYRATLEIMTSAPTPIIIVSASASSKDSSATFLALDAGALAVVRRPPGSEDPGYPAAARALIQTVVMMSEVKVERRGLRVKTALPTAPPRRLIAASTGTFQLVAIGASIGGPAVLNTILSLLTPSLPVPVLIVQHISPGFVDGFVDWLSAASGFPLHLAANGQRLEPGHGYIAPDGYHMGVASSMRLVLSSHPAEYGSRPSVSYLFQTVAQVMGPRAVGVLLTGMGRDGAEGLLRLREAGGATIAQDEASSVVHGMPGEAIKLGAADHVLSPSKIAATLIDLTRNAKDFAK